MKTKSLKLSEVEKSWWIADADSQVLGRLASKIAQILKGKHKVNYVPHLDNGDCVVVINAEKIMVTGNKEDQKTYFRHTGYAGGVKTTNLAHLRRTYPERIIENKESLNIDISNFIEDFSLLEESYISGWNPTIEP